MRVSWAGLAFSTAARYDGQKSQHIKDYLPTKSPVTDMISMIEGSL